MKRINNINKTHKALLLGYVSSLVILFFIIVMDTFINKDFDFIRVLIISIAYLVVTSAYFTALFFVLKTAGRDVREESKRVREKKAVKKTVEPSHTMKRYWLLVLIYLGLIFTLSSISDLPYVSKITEMDPRKFSLHIIEYGVFSFLLYTAMSNTKTGSIHKMALILTILAGVTVGIFDELYQSGVPGRRFNPLDILSDGVGIITGAMIAYVRRRRLWSHTDNQSKGT
jgi:VanZ like family